MSLQEKKIIETGFEHLRSILGNQLTWDSTRDLAPGLNSYFDLNRAMVYVEAKDEVRTTHIDEIFHQKRQLGNVTVIANYIAPNAKELLLEQGINYIDKGGNISFKHNTIHVHVEGKLNKPTTEAIQSKAFTKTGTKVVYQLLTNPATIHKPYREIAKLSGVALGTIPNVFTALKEENYLNQNEQGILSLAYIEELIKQWCEAYLNNLKPNLFVQSYEPINEHFQTKWKALNGLSETCYGGCAGAAFLKEGLQPDQFLIYSSKSEKALRDYYQIRPAKDGIIKVYDNFGDKKASDISSKLLIYADLMDRNQAKYIQLANELLEDILVEFIRDSHPSKILKAV
jgi:hypothetical protein